MGERALHRALGQRIQELRKEGGSTRIEFARACGLPSVTELRAYESGRAEVALSTLERIARTLRVAPFQLLTFPGDGFVELHVDSLRRMTLSSFVVMLHAKEHWQEPKAATPVAELVAQVLAMPAGGSKLRAVEDALVEQGVLANRGNLTKAALLLGIERKAVERRWRRICAKGR